VVPVLVRFMAAPKCYWEPQLAPMAETAVPISWVVLPPPYGDSEKLL